MSARNLDSPEQLWDLFAEYEKGLEVIQVPQSHVKLGVVYLDIKAAMTMEGFKDFCYDKVGVIKHYIDNTDGNYEEYCTIITRIKDRIYNHNLVRAAAGLYKENLIAKQLGLAAKIEQTNYEQPLFNNVPKDNSDRQDTESK